MAKEWFSFFLISIITTTTSECSAHREESCFRPTAALNLFDSVYLIDGNEYVVIDSDFKEVDSGTVSEEFGLENEIGAAFVDPEEDEVYFNSGTEYYQYSYWSMSAEGPLDNSDMSPFLSGGVDAAGSVGDKSYVFKGCKYWTGKEDGEEGDVKSLGLPCDVDAAWRGQDEKLYVTKEGEYWTLDKDGQVTGPEKLSKLVTLKSTEFCFQKGATGNNEIEDEQEYEREHNCVIIDAAITWKGRIYLFNDDEYLAFYSQGQQYRRAPISYWGGLGSNIDAGVVWSGNRATYFFKDDHYHKYTKSGVSGPRSINLWASRFAQGIDAAGNLRGKTYFFQGCEILRYAGPRARVDRVFKSGDIDLPCNVDAAFSIGQSLYVIKFNQIWFFHNRHFIGPKDLTSVLRVKSWNICSPP